MYILIALGGTNEDYGMVGYSAVTGMLGFKSDSPIVTKSGEVVNNAVVFCENAHLGTYVHDTLHMLGGVINDQRMTPCLYDHDLQAKYTGGEDWPKILVNMGFWDPLASEDAATQVIKKPVSDSTYYLVENRQPIDSDVNLPSSGVLIAFADDTGLECRHGRRRSRSWTPIQRRPISTMPPMISASKPFSSMRKTTWRSSC